jgi:hypothetical protein
MASSTCEASGLLSCLICERPLAFLGRPLSATLRCDAGHEVTFRDVLACPSPSQRDGLLLLLEGWRRRLEAITAAADDARRRCIPDVAEMFLAHAGSLRGHIALLMEAFAGAEETSLVESTKVG